MTPSEALATTVVDELVRVGVRHVVLCPGSRSAPLAYALADADRRGRLTLHVRVDERSAAFLALGMGAASGVPAAVVTTSGTAVANLHPAVLEASEAGVPLLLLTADRPPELRGTRANQTTDQVKLFGAAVRWAHDLGAPEGGDPALRAASWRTAVDRAVTAARGDLGGDPGPVHLNVPFRDPLAPELDDVGSPLAPEPTVADEAPAATGDPMRGRADGGPWVRIPAAEVARWGTGEATTLEVVPRTLVIVGDTSGGAGGAAGADALARAAFDVAARYGWPVVAEPFGPGDRADVLPHGPLVAAVPGVVAAHPPERILVVGRVTLSRDTAALVRTPGATVDLVTPRAVWPDPSHVVHRVHTAAALFALAERAAQAGDRRGDADAPVGGSPVASPPANHAWSDAWRAAGRAVERAVRPTILGSWPTGPALAEVVLDALTDPELRGPGDGEPVLFVGSSNSARDVETARGAAGPTVRANRGLAGIDGCLATAMGHALARPGVATYALVGDLTFLHDAGALALGASEPQPDLTIVVADDSGGGIFSTLEYGQPARLSATPGAHDVFERVFATATGTRLAELCRAHGVPCEDAAAPGALRAALARRPDGLRVVRVPLPRDTHRSIRARLTQAAAQAVGDHRPSGGAGASSA